MNIPHRLKPIFYSKKLAILSTLITIVSFPLSVYYSVFYEKKPQLDFLVTSNSRVIDINENTVNLDVLFQGKSLNGNNEDLSIINLKIINTGNDSLLPSHYDKLNPVGLELIDGDLAEPPLITSASKSYDRSKIIIDFVDNKLTLPRLTIDPNEFYDVKLLVLHNINTTPYLITTGKIAKSESLFVVSNLESSFFHPTVRNHWVEVLLYYTMLSIITISVIFITLFVYLELTEEVENSTEEHYHLFGGTNINERRKAVSLFIEYNKKSISSSDYFYLDRYITGDYTDIYIAKTILNDQDKVFPHLKKIKKNKNRFNSTLIEMEQLNLIKENNENSYSSSHKSKESLNKFLILIDNLGHQPALEIISTIDKSLDFLLSRELSDKNIEEYYSNTFYVAHVVTGRLKLDYYNVNS